MISTENFVLRREKLRDRNKRNINETKKKPFFWEHSFDVSEDPFNRLATRFNHGDPLDKTNTGYMNVFYVFYFDHVVIELPSLVPRLFFMYL